MSSNYVSIGILTGVFLIIFNFGLIERYTSDIENQGIEDRVEWQQASVSSISNNSFTENLFGYGHGNFGIVNDKVDNLTEFSDDVTPTGPHNSFLFIILNYGFLGLLIFLNIFLRPFLIFLNDLKKNFQEPHYLFLGRFVALSFTGDFIQNHSISVLFFLTFFTLITDINHE